MRELNQLLVAENCPKDTRSVILLPGIMFLRFHETIGHPHRLDRILGYGLAFAGGSFVRLEDFGKLRYGSEKLTVRAGTLPENSPGSFGFDDDGVPAQNNLLIDKGILVGAITSAGRWWKKPMPEPADRFSAAAAAPARHGFLPRPD